jgi:hypothetical protein
MNRKSICALALGWGLALVHTSLGCQSNDEGEASGRCVVTSDCRGGEMCQEGICLPVELGESSDDGGPADDGHADSGPADSGPVTTSPADSGPADSGPADSGPSDSGPAPSPSCNEGDFSCEVDHIVACVDGDWEEYTCDDVCGSQGYTSSGCTGDQCNCDGFADEECATGVAAFCTCLESTGQSCSNDDYNAFYQECFTGAAPEFACFADYVTNNQVDCTSAVEACL